MNNPETRIHRPVSVLLAILMFSLFGCAANAAATNAVTFPRGHFLGLFYSEDNPAFESSGFFSAECTRNGSFSANLRLGGKRHAFSGRYSSSGVFSGSVGRGTNSLDVSIQMDLTSGTNCTGTVSSGTWSADLVAYRASIGRNVARAPGTDPGRYPVRIVVREDLTPGPTNEGAGTIRLLPSRVAHVRGTLGDGAKFSQSTIVCGNQLPFYSTLYDHRGSILGWITFNPISRTNGPSGVPIISTPGPFGDVNWFKSAGIDSNYPSGFSFQTIVDQ
jgi:hypothetical protein